MTIPFRILIVEDNNLTALSLQTGLIREGFEVCGAGADYREAVRLIKSEKPDLLLVDIELGEGMADGIAVAREFRRLSSAPILFLTGLEDPAIFDEAKDVNPAAFLQKPFRIEEVARQVNLALHNRYGKEGITGVDDVIYIPDGYERIRVKIADIAYVEAAGAYTRIFLLTAGPAGPEKLEKLVAVNLANVKVHLTPHFYDVSRSLTINLAHLDRIGTRTIHLGSYEVEIPAGKAKQIMESVKLVRSEKKKGSVR